MCVEMHFSGVSFNNHHCEFVIINSALKLFLNRLNVSHLGCLLIREC